MRPLRPSRALVPPLIVIAVVMAVYQNLVCRQAGSTLPPPSRLFRDTKAFSTRSSIAAALTRACSGVFPASLQRVAMGYAMAAIAGVALGTLVGQVDVGHARPRSYFPGAAHRPAAAWLPLSLAAFRRGNPRQSLSFSSPPSGRSSSTRRSASETFRGTIATSPRCCDFQSVPVFREDHGAVQPAPYIFTGLRIGIGLSWLAIVAAEMLIGGVGIGFFIWDAWNSSHISEIILALIYVGLVGFVLDRMVAGVASIVTRGTAANWITA